MSPDTACAIGHRVTVGKGAPLVLIAGPCVIESADHCRGLASELKRLAGEAGLPLVFKASFDKANRTAGDSFRGPGLDAGLQILSEIGAALDLPLLTDIHRPEQAEPAAAVVDCLQIPAFLCRQTDLITAAAATGKAVNIKKGQFVAPLDMRGALAKAQATGNRQVMLTERGTSFGYNNLVVDFRSLGQMASLGAPVVFDATHSVQLPAAGTTVSGGQPEFIGLLARAAVAAGVDAIFVEAHDDPPRALSDGANALPLSQLPGLLQQIVAIDGARRRHCMAEEQS